MKNKKFNHQQLIKSLSNIDINNHHSITIILNDLNEIFELDFHNMKKSENVTNYDKKIMTRFMSELVKYHFPDVKSFKVAKDLFN